MTTQLCRRIFRLNIKKRMLWRVTLLRRYIGSLWNQILACWIGKPTRYRQLPHSPPASGGCSALNMASPADSSSDLVALKISLLGDSQIGKTSFLTKYVGREKGEDVVVDGSYPMSDSGLGLQQMHKTLSVGGARISYSIWEVGGTDSSHDHIPTACKDSVAILFMFDLTSRCTLNSVISWYEQARKWNQTAIPVLIGTKFDDFVQLPLALQWTIASQARAYARALNATLFFSSATYNINVNKIFKFITARLFNLPWTLERNLTIGEPIIDF